LHNYILNDQEAMRNTRSAMCLRITGFH